MESPLTVKVLNNGKQFPLFRKDKISWLLFQSDMGHILVVHGGEDGSLAADDILNNILANNRVDWIHCCHPKQVIEKHPEIKDKVLFQTIDTVTCFTNKYVGEFNKKSEEYTEVTFWPCPGKNLKYENNEWRQK